MITKFTTDEQFHQWCEDHQDDGFFVGYAPDYPPKVARPKTTNTPKMHRASCKVATTRNRPGHYTDHAYRKCGSTDRSELVAYFAPAGLEYCGHGRPDAADA